VFEKNNYEKHKQKHAVLRQPDFCPTRIIKTLQEPTFTIKGNTKNSRCYYLEEYSKNGIMIFTKVVVHEKDRTHSTSPICKVKTAFRTSVIKETIYGYKKEYYT
jgi:hypothetical protein